MARLRDGACSIGDRPSTWSELFLLHRDELLRFLRRRAGWRHQANDLLHEVFLRVSAPTVAEPRGDARAYLFRAAASVAIDAARADRHRDRESPEANDRHSALADPAPDALQMLIDREALRRLDAALAEMPEEVRAMVYLLRVDRCGYDEVARMFGVSKSTVEKRVAKALRHCRESLAGDDPEGR